MFYLAQALPVIISVLKGNSCTINSMESTKETISRLKFIGKVGVNEKINVKYMTVHTEGVITQLTRTLIPGHQCNRQNALNFVRSTVLQSCTIIKTYMGEDVGSRKYNMLSNVVIDLRLSKQGIVNLKNTYLDDLKVGCDLDTLIQEIDAFLEELSIAMPESVKFSSE